MKFVESKNGEVTVLKLEGILKMGEASRELGMRLGNLAEAKSTVVVDLSLLDSVDSTGIGVLVGAWKLFHDAVVPLFLAAPSRRVLSSLHITNLDTLFLVRPTLAEAVKEAAGAAAGEETKP